MNMYHRIIITLVLSLTVLSGCLDRGPTTEMYIGAYQGDVRQTLTHGNEPPSSSEFLNQSFTIVEGNNADLLFNYDSCIIPANLGGEGFTIVKDTPCSYSFDGFRLDLRTNGDGFWDARDRLNIEYTQTGMVIYDNGLSSPIEFRMTVTGKRL